MQIGTLWSRFGLLLIVAVVAAVWPALPAGDIGTTYETGAARLPLDLTAGAGAPATGERTSAPIALPFDASSLGVHWTQAPGAAVAVAVRASEDGRQWSAWHPVEAEGSAASAGEQRLYSGLAAVEAARFAQVRLAPSAGGDVAGEATDVELIALRSTPRPDSRLAAFLSPGDSAAAAIKPLGIVSRAQWGADERLRFDAAGEGPKGEIWPEDVQRVEKIVVHHTAGANVCSSREVYCQRRSVIAINDIYYYHAVVNGWGDIGYNSLIGYDGRIYEGRHGPEPLDETPLAAPVVAGHAYGYNNRTHGIALMGDFMLEPVPDLEYDALAVMVGWIVRSQLVAGGAIDPLGATPYTLSDGEIVRGVPNIVGHRDVVADTECPGDYLYARLEELRGLAKQLAEWPPLQVNLHARPEGNAIAFHIFVQNHEPAEVGGLVIKAAVPPNATLVDTWAGSPGFNRAAFDGSILVWNDPDATLAPGVDRREYVFVLRPRPGVDRAAVATTAWVEFERPTPGRAMSEVARGDQPITLLADSVLDRSTTSTGGWVRSTNVETYYGADYAVRPAGAGAARFDWLLDVMEPGDYEVFAWWPAADDRATNAPFTVYARDGDHVVRVDQQANGGRWVSLGAYPFGRGRAVVSLSDDADGYVVADAVKLVKR